MPNDFLDGADAIAVACGWFRTKDGRPDRDKVYREYAAGRLDVTRLEGSRQLTSTVGRIRRSRYEPTSTITLKETA
jgi:hypothetical protein